MNLRIESNQMAKNIPTKIFDSVLKDQTYLDQYGIGLNRQIQKLLKKVQDEITGVIAKNDPTSPLLTKWKQARLKKLDDEISVLLEDSYKNINLLTKTELVKMGKLQVKRTANSFNKAVGVNIFDVALDKNTIKSIVNNTMIDGKVIGDWWKGQRDKLGDRISQAMAKSTQALQIGMVQGETVGGLITRIRGTALTPGVMSLAKREATALVRTSVMQVANGARQELYKENADVLEGVEFVATLDNRTTPLCRSIDGLRYDMEYNPNGHSRSWPGSPPLHWQCRTTLCPIPLSYSKLAGANSPLTNKQIRELDKMPPGVRSTLNGDIPTNMTYGSWLKTLPAAEQKDILGAGRYKLYSENKLDMADLVNNSGKPLTLEQLRAKLS